jgi:hypothetical protein
MAILLHFLKNDELKLMLLYLYYCHYFYLNAKSTQNRSWIFNREIPIIDQFCEFRNP